MHHRLGICVHLAHLGRQCLVRQICQRAGDAAAHIVGVGIDLARGAEFDNGDVDLPRPTTRGEGAPTPPTWRRQPGWRPKGKALYHPPFRTGCDLDDVTPIRSDDFH